MRVIERSAHSPCCRIWPPFDCEENCFGGRGGRYLVVKDPALSAAESQTTWSGSKQDQASPERNVCGQKSYINVEPRVLKKNRGCLKSSPCVSISISARAVHRLPLFDESNLRSSFFSHITRTTAVLHPPDVMFPLLYGLTSSFRGSFYAYPLLTLSSEYLGRRCTP